MMIKSKCFVTLSAASLLLPAIASATDYSWNSSPNANWATTTSWTPASPVGGPTSADNIITPTFFGSLLVNVANAQVTNWDYNTGSGVNWSVIGFNGDTNVATVNITGAITKSGAGGLTFRGSSAINLLRVSVGSVSVSNGSLAFGSNSGITAIDSFSADSISVTGGTLSFVVGATTGTANVTGALDMNGSTGAVNVRQGTSPSSGVLSVGSLTGGGGLTYIQATDKDLDTYANSGTVLLKNASGTSTFAGVIRNGGSFATMNVTMDGTGGTQVLTGTNTYTGATTVSGGTLQIGTGGSINGTSGVTVNGGKFRYDSATGLNKAVTVNGGTFSYNSSSAFTGTLTFTSGKLGGTNFTGKDLSIGASQTLAPGNSTGTMGSGAVTFANSGTFEFEINDATGTAGSSSAGWDLLNATSLNITAATGQFTVKLISLDALQAAGSAQNFNSASSYQWLFLDAGSAITSFSSDQFIINTAGFQNSIAGTFAIARGDEIGIGGDNTQLYLTYTAGAAVPEPSTYALLFGGAAFALVAGRRRRR
jgi:autotransporter-associated beta strand protein